MDLENYKYELPMMYKDELVMEMTNFQSDNIKFMLLYVPWVNVLQCIYIIVFLSDQSFYIIGCQEMTKGVMAMQAELVLDNFVQVELARFTSLVVYNVKFIK